MTKSILVVEDGHAEQKIVKGLLSHAGFEVAIASNVDEGWEWLQKHDSPNLIILDIVMPEKSGLELCRMIKEEEKFSEIPIIFCSSKSEEYDQFWALRQGGNAYVVKPYAPKDLLDTVYKHIQ